MRIGTIGAMVGAMERDDPGRDYLGAGGYAAAAFVALLVLPPPGMNDWSTPAQVLAGLGVGAVVFSVVQFRRRPTLGLPLLGVVIVAALLANAAAVAILLLFELLYAANVYAARRMRLLAFLVAAAVNVLLLALPFIAEGPRTDALVVAVQTLVLSILAAWWGQSVRLLRERAETERAAVRAQARLAAKERELSHASSSLAVAAERIRVGRDIHDLVAGRLAVISLQAAMAQSAIDDPDATAARIRDIRLCSDATLGSVRAMISALSQNDDSLDPMTVLDGAASLVQTVRAVADAGVAVRLTDRLDATDCPRAQTLYLIAEELVVNMLRHAAPCRADVWLESRDGRLSLVARNTRSGEPGVARSGTSAGSPQSSPTHSASGRGLNNIRDRVAPLRGTVVIERDHPARFTVTVCIPMTDSEITTWRSSPAEPAPASSAP